VKAISVVVCVVGFVTALYFFHEAIAVIRIEIVRHVTITDRWKLIRKRAIGVVGDQFVAVADCSEESRLFFSVRYDRVRAVWSRGNHRIKPSRRWKMVKPLPDRRCDDQLVSRVRRKVRHSLYVPSWGRLSPAIVGCCFCFGFVDDFCHSIC